MGDKSPVDEVKPAAKEFDNASLATTLAEDGEKNGDQDKEDMSTSKAKDSDNASLATTLALKHRSLRVCCHVPPHPSIHYVLIAPSLLNIVNGSLVFIVCWWYMSGIVASTNPLRSKASPTLSQSSRGKAELCVGMSCI